MITTTPGLRTAARIASGDDGTRYDAFAITLHWLTAALVAIQFALGVSWEWFARPTRDLMIVAHISFGIILAAVIATRIVWRLMPAGLRAALVGQRGDELDAAW